MVVVAAVDADAEDVTCTAAVDDEDVVVVAVSNSCGTGGFPTTSDDDADVAVGFNDVMRLLLAFVAKYPLKLLLCRLLTPFTKSSSLELKSF